MLTGLIYHKASDPLPGFELLGISKDTPFEDERPLLVPGQPEIREYKMRFWDAGQENGDWTDVASATVSL